MFEMFVNPWSMMAGTALVSAPIIIHLINRMRFKRIRWAAMEFLLKSQKRAKRKLIIEQLILLLLRILLVLLFGMLLARFLGFSFGGSEPQSTLHVVILDDTASMGDFWNDEGKRRDSFGLATASITDEIAKSAAQATTPQAMHVIRLSDLDTPRVIDRLNSSTIEDLRDYLAKQQVSAAHVPLALGLKRAQQIFDDQPKLSHVLHVVSDFRASDWTGTKQESLKAVFEQLNQARVKVHLVDVAHPVQAETQKTPTHHDNLGIIDFQPEAKVVPRYTPIEFTLTVGNYSNNERKNVRVAIKVNGRTREDSSFQIPSLPPASRVTQSFTIPMFERLGSEKQPLERFNIVSATLDNQEPDSGLAIDNTRYAVVEVREKVPILVIEGDLANRGKKEDEAFYLQKIFNEAVKGYEFTVKGVAELERTDLNQFPSIFLLNVPELKEKQLKNLEEYVRNGGGLAFFLGDKVKADFYNKSLYAEGAGLFPAPLEEKPTEGLTEQQRIERLFSFQLQVFPREETHPALARIYRDERSGAIRNENNKFLLYVVLDRYFKVPRPKWNVDRGSVTELLTLPNYAPVSTYEPTVQRLLNSLPIDDPGNEKFAATLKKHRTAIKELAAGSKPLYTLANAIDAMLNDNGAPNDPAKPNLQEFWQKPDNAGLRADFQRLLDTVRYGDPLYIAKNYGKGRVTAFMSSAGESWSDWPKYGPGQPYYVMLMIEMQKYLAGTGADANPAIGVPLEMTFDPARYGPKVTRYEMFNDAKTAALKKNPNEEKAELSPIVSRGDQVSETDEAKQYRFRFNESKEPVLYVFELTANRPPASVGDGPSTVKEAVAYAFNVDTLAEGDLRRADRDELTRTAPGAKIHVPGSDWKELEQKQRDFSESPWFYLLILFILVAEQAWAVRLSYHLKDGGAAPPAAATLGATPTTV